MPSLLWPRNRGHPFLFERGFLSLLLCSPAALLFWLFLMGWAEYSGSRRSKKRGARKGKGSSASSSSAGRGGGGGPGADSLVSGVGESLLEPGLLVQLCKDVLKPFDLPEEVVEEVAESLRTPALELERRVQRLGGSKILRASCSTLRPGVDDHFFPSIPVPFLCVCVCVCVSPGRSVSKASQAASNRRRSWRLPSMLCI